MKTGIVISLAISSRGNKIFRAGDEVNENNFPHGNWVKAVNAGHIKENETSSDEVSKKDEDDDHSSKNKIESIDDISVDQLKKDLRDADIGYSKKADKETLYELWLTIKK